MGKKAKLIKKYFVEGRNDKDNVKSEYNNLLEARMFARHIFRQGNFISLTNSKGTRLAI